MPTILVILAVLAGFSVSFGLGSFVTWLAAGRTRAAGAFGCVSLGFATYVLLQVAILSTNDLGAVADLLRWQGAALAAVFVAQVYFGAAFAERGTDWFDHVVAAAYVALGGWALASPAGYWFSAVAAIEPTQVSGGVIYHPRGPLAWTYAVSIALQYPLFVRQLLDGPRMVRRGARIDGSLWTIGVGVVLATATHDHLVDLGVVSPPYIGELSFPLLIAAVAARNSLHRNREHVHLRTLQASLARSEARLRDLYEGSSDAIFVQDAATGAILDLNQTATNMYGYTREECQSVAVEDLSAPTPEQSRERMLERLAEAQSSGRASFAWQARRKDGSVFPVEVTLKPTTVGGRACVVASVRDLTERQAAAEALRQSEVRYRSLFESAAEAIFIIDEGRFVDCNSHALTLLGCERREQLIGLSPYELSPPVQPDGTPSREAAAGRIEAALAGAPQRFEWIHQRLDGTSFLAEVSLVAIELDGKPHLLAIARDVTERRRLDERLQQSRRLESIGQLAGGVAHDFNNLLMPIMGHVELLLSELPERDPMREPLGEVQAAAGRAQRLTRQLLTFGRKAVLDVRPLALNRLLREMEGLLRRLLREDIDLRLELAEQELVVRADASQLEQVLINLATNARDAMPTGGRLTVRTRHAELSGPEAQSVRCDPGPYALLIVSDTGIGMTDEVRSRIFEPFFTTKDATRGTGLGLATVFGIVRQHGGTLQVSSEPGAGTSFRVFIPTTQEDTSAEERPAHREERHGNELVLVVEDDDAVRRLARSVLERSGYRVEACPTPDAALALFDRLDEMPALVLTDVVMPGTNGRSLYEALRAQAPSLRALFMSGYAGDVISPHGMLEPGVPLIEKPFTAKELLARVRSALDEPLADEH